MARGHPVDAAGRILRSCDWPADKHAPDGLELVRRFCNTINRESGTDRLRDPAGFDAWLIEQARPAVDATDRQVADLRALRDHLHDAATCHRERRDDAAEVNAIAEHVGGIRFRFVPSATPIAIAPISTVGTIDGLLGELAVATITALADGTWRRLSSCRNCGWVVYDRSKNSSNKWCSMSACGGRSKQRAHRQRNSNSPG